MLNLPESTIKVCRFNSSNFLKIPPRYAYNNHMLLHIQLSLDFSSIFLKVPPRYACNNHMMLHIQLSLDFSSIFLKVNYELSPMYYTFHVSVDFPRSHVVSKFPSKGQLEIDRNARLF